MKYLIDKNGLHYQESHGSLYLYEGKNLVRMVDGTNEIAFAFDRITMSMVKTGSLASVDAFARKANTTFAGSWDICTLTFPKGFNVEVINHILATKHVGFLVKEVLPAGSTHTPALEG